MGSDEKGSRKWSRFTEILYLILLALSFSFLLASRAVEARTVWEVMNPLFIPTFFAATFFLLLVLLTSEDTTHKLALVIVHSVLLHSFFSVVLPAGDTSGQQMYLGRIRFAFDNPAVRAWMPSSNTSILSLVFQLFRGTNFQASLSTVFARMFSVDIFWIHLFLVPILWGVFTPIATFSAVTAVGGNERIAALSSLLLSVFPYTIYFGAISVPTSLGFIFFFFALNLALRYPSSETSKNELWMLTFSGLSFLSNYLTGIISFAVIIIAVAFKAYKREKSSSATRVFSFLAAFALSASLLPLSFAYLSFFNPSTNVTFTLDNFYTLPVEKIVGLFLIGELINGFSLRTVILVVIGPGLAFIWMIYSLYELKKHANAGFGAQSAFLFASFMIIFVDYRILKLFTSGLPINAERLWVLSDFILAPFLALAIYQIVSWIKTHLNIKSPLEWASALANPFRKQRLPGFLSSFLVVNLILSFALGGWIIGSASVAYPQFAPLQVTSYELEAVKFIKDTTKENYVVIGDLWTVYAGEMVVGIFNHQAYYFGEFDQRRQNLFERMLNETSPQIMMEAMNQTGTNTNLAYFIVTEPRLITEEYSRVVLKAQEQIGPPFYVADGGKLYVFSYEKE